MFSHLRLHVNPAIVTGIVLGFVLGGLAFGLLGDTAQADPPDQQNPNDQVLSITHTREVDWGWFTGEVEASVEGKRGEWIALFEDMGIGIAPGTDPMDVRNRCRNLATTILEKHLLHRPEQQQGEAYEDFLVRRL